MLSLSVSYLIYIGQAQRGQAYELSNVPTAASPSGDGDFGDLSAFLDEVYTGRHIHSPSNPIIYVTLGQVNPGRTPARER